MTTTLVNNCNNMATTCTASCLKEIAANVSERIEITPGKVFVGLIAQFVMTYLVLVAVNWLLGRYGGYSYVPSTNNTLMYLSIGFSIVSMIAYIIMVRSLTSSGSARALRY